MTEFQQAELDRLAGLPEAAGVLAILRNPLVSAVWWERNEKEFFGQGWSHFPKSFKHSDSHVNYYLSVYNTPNHVQVNWHVSGTEGEWRAGYSTSTGALFALTPEESLALAAELGLDLGAWLAEALEACRTDVTADTIARTGNVVDLPNFHAARAGDDV